MTAPITRRTFLRYTSVAGASLVGAPLVRAASPHNTLNVAAIGTANRAAADISAVARAGGNIMALCDVDATFLSEAAKKYAHADTYRDYRRMLEERKKDIDAVIVATPDHHHAPAAIRAMELGKHVYCEKPLAHCVYGVRRMTETAVRTGVATQMGTQIHSLNNYRRVVEKIRAGAIGPVRQVHVWKQGGVSGGKIPSRNEPIPADLKWNTWIGPAEPRPYHSDTYHPHDWRGWWDFGSGRFGDFGCHYMDVPFWALDLKYPETIAAYGPPPKAERTPRTLTVHYQYPARRGRPPVKMSWYNGHRSNPLPFDFARWSQKPWRNGAVLFVGDKGKLLTNYHRHILLPEEKFAAYEPPPRTIPSSIGHHKEWVRACKGGPPASCRFTYGGPLTETVLLGNVAYRSGQKFHWNAQRLEAVHAPEAQHYIREPHREGWRI